MSKDTRQSSGSDVGKYSELITLFQVHQQWLYISVQDKKLQWPISNSMVHNQQSSKWQDNANFNMQMLLANDMETESGGYFRNR